METDGFGNITSMADVPTVDMVLCTGCGRCVAVCPKRMISLETIRFHKHAVITNAGHCNLCALCAEACPVAAILWKNSIFA